MLDGCWLEEGGLGLGLMKVKDSTLLSSSSHLFGFFPKCFPLDVFQ